MNKKMIGTWVFIFVCTLAAEAQQLVAFRNNKGLWGFKDASGKVAVTPLYIYRPGDFSDGRSIISISFNKKGAIDETGKVIIPATYHNLTDFKNGFTIASTQYLDTVNKLYGKPQTVTLKGVFDRNGKEIIPVRYRNLTGDFSNGWFVLADTGGKEKFYFDTRGQRLEPPAGITLLHEAIDGKMFIAHKSYKYGLVDKNFKEILPFEYQSIRYSGQPGLLIVSKSARVGLMDYKLNWVVKPEFYSISLFQGGYAGFTDSSKLNGAINAKGKITVKPQFEHLYRIEKTSSSLAVFKNPRNDNSGLVDLATGKIVLPNNYQFREYSYAWGLIDFRKDGKKVLIDSTGRLIFGGDYEDFVTGSREGINWIRKEGKYGFMTKIGQILVPAQYESVLGFSEGMAAVKMAGLWGFIDRSGKVVIPVQYKEAGSFEGGVARVKDKNDQTVFIGPSGQVQ